MRDDEARGLAGHSVAHVTSETGGRCVVVSPMASWKDTVNAGLRRTTGYILTRDPRAAGGARAAQQRGAGGAAAPAGKRRGRRKGLPGHYDQEMRRIIKRVRPRTMTAHVKLSGLILATRYVVQHQIPGDIVECGVWRGGSMQAVALTLMGLGSTERDLHLFDTFEGMPPPTEHDLRQDGTPAAELLARASRDASVWAVAGLEDVQQGMAEVGYPAEKVHFHRGLVEETIPAAAPETISILRLDTDWYESTKHELEHLYKRLSPGGVLIIDDYGHWEGSRRATDEFLDKTGEPLLLVPMNTGRIAVKPLR